MKQHISVEQLEMLNEKGREEFQKVFKSALGDQVLFNHYGRVGLARVVKQDVLNLDCWRVRVIWDEEFSIRKDNGMVLISIGQMIQFLGDDWYVETNIAGGYEPDYIMTRNNELCDALWQACVTKLNK